MKYIQNKEDLHKQLKDQILFLILSAENFDKGITEEAKRLAVTLRTLIHHTKNSKALLFQLGYNNLKFYNTAEEYDSNNLLPTMALIGMRHKQGKWSYVALLDDLPTKPNKIQLDDWWLRKIVFKDKNNNKLTRKDLICYVANQDGGTHVDPTLTKEYADITKNNSLGWIQTTSDGYKELEINPVFASIRQITHEVLKTFKEELPEYFILN